MTTLRRSARVASQKSLQEYDEPFAKKDKVTKVSKPVKKEAKLKAKLEDKIEEIKETPSVSTSDEIEIGDAIPDLTLSDQDDNDINLREIASEKRILIIFAYPRASTPGCTRQACGFRDNFNSVKAKATVLGLSADTTKAQKQFATKQKLQYPLLSDPKKQLIEILGAKKKPSGIIRSHWIFVDGVLKVKKIGIKPEDSFTKGKKDIEELYDSLKEESNDKESEKKEE